MAFVYDHILGFAAWMVLVESDPWPKLTLVMSLEAIFLSTFVMIGQKRQAEFQRAKADHDYTTEAQELRLNTELTQAIHTLTSTRPSQRTVPRGRHQGVLGRHHRHRDRPVHRTSTPQGQTNPPAPSLYPARHRAARSTRQPRNDASVAPPPKPVPSGSHRDSPPATRSRLPTQREWRCSPGSTPSPPHMPRRSASSSHSNPPRTSAGGSIGTEHSPTPPIPTRNGCPSSPPRSQPSLQRTPPRGRCRSSDRMPLPRHARDLGLPTTRGRASATHRGSEPATGRLTTRTGPFPSLSLPNQAET